jgi:hypothetical protein
MAARPWENTLLDSNAKESVVVRDDKPAEEEKAKAPNKPKGKVPASTTQSNGSPQKKGAGHKKSHSYVSGSSSGHSATLAMASSLLPAFSIYPAGPLFMFQKIFTSQFVKMSK